MFGITNSLTRTQGGVEFLPTDFVTVRRLFEADALQLAIGVNAGWETGLNGPEPVCKQCSNEERAMHHRLTHFCSQCRGFLCEECALEHLRMRDFVHHQVRFKMTTLVCVHWNAEILSYFCSPDADLAGRLPPRHTHACGAALPYTPRRAAAAVLRDLPSMCVPGLCVSKPQRPFAQRAVGEQRH